MGTLLSPVEELLFRRWYADMAKERGWPHDPDAPGMDYDYRGFWKQSFGTLPRTEKEWSTLGDLGQHFTDQFKYPNHETFSTESQYYQPGMESWGIHSVGEWLPGDQYLRLGSHVNPEPKPQGRVLNPQAMASFQAGLAGKPY